MQSGNIGYEVDKWYMVEINYEIFIPAKFVGLRPGCDFESNPFHSFPHPGQAVFENIKLFQNHCGFEGDRLGGGGVGIGMDKDRYFGFKPKYRQVTEKELWAVQAIEEFQKVIAGQKQTFSIVMNSGWKFEGKVKPPMKKDNLPGKYYAHIVNKKTGEERKGHFDYYNGSCESTRSFLNSKLSSPEDWHIHTLKFKGESFGLKQESD